MSAVTRLVTFVDLREGVGDACQMAVSARHEAVLLDGRRVLLLDDRGWSSSARTAFYAGAASDPDSAREEQTDIWAMTSVEDIEQEARMVVGPTSRSTVSRKRTQSKAIGRISATRSGSTASSRTP